MTARDASRLHAPHAAIPSHTDAPRQLVLLGAGDAHLYLLGAIAKQPLPGVRVVLVNPSANPIHPSMLAGWVAGYYSREACSVSLEPLVRHCGARLLVHSATALDAQQQTLTLDDGSTLAYDWLSIDTGPTQSRALTDITMPGSRTHGLFLHPIDAFAALWPRVVELGHSRALRVAVVGSGGTAIEMASAVRQRLPTAALTLVSGTHASHALGTGAAPALAALRQAGVTVLQETVTSIEADRVCLASGATLACDVPLLATPSHPPSWLAQSALALAEDGYLATNDYLQSITHANVFCTGAYSSGGGTALWDILRAAIAYGPLQAHVPQPSALKFVSCGKRYAIGCWGQYCVQGHWVWWLKYGLDKRHLAKLQSVTA